MPPGLIPIKYEYSIAALVIGGVIAFALELRINAARTPKDIDLTMRSISSAGEKKDDKKTLAVLEKLPEAAAFRSGDFFVYKIGRQFPT